MDNDDYGLKNQSGKKTGDVDVFGNSRNIKNSSDYVTQQEFKTFMEGDEKLCAAYRAHQQDLIEGVRDELKNAIYLTSTILGLIIAAMTIIMMVVRG